MGKHTPGPWFVGAQNDALYIVAGRAPSPDNDYPWHDAPRVAVAKVYEATANDALPVNDKANARLLAAAPDLLDALTELMAMLREEAPGTPLNNHRFDALGIKANDAIAKATA